MNKKKQIEEMARDFGEQKGYGCRATTLCCKECILQGDCVPYSYAEGAYNAGYRKLPEGAVVLTKEEFEKLHALKDDYVKGYEAGVDEGWDNACKVTAEKFAERADKRIAQCQGERDGYEAFTIDDKAKYDGDIVSLALLEICKGLTEIK